MNGQGCLDCTDPPWLDVREGEKENAPLVVLLLLVFIKNQRIIPVLHTGSPNDARNSAVDFNAVGDHLGHGYHYQDDAM